MTGWIIVKGKVYDVTDFAVKHPGGRVIYTYGGKDATDVFTAFHAGALLGSARRGPGSDGSRRPMLRSLWTPLSLISGSSGPRLPRMVRW